MRSLSAILNEVEKRPKKRALSSVGRASRLHRECRGFESLSAHYQKESLLERIFFVVYVTKAQR